MEAPHRGGGADLEEVWASPGGLTHSAPLGLDAIVQTCPPAPCSVRPGEVWYRSRLSGASVLAVLAMILH